MPLPRIEPPESKIEPKKVVSASALEPSTDLRPAETIDAKLQQISDRLQHAQLQPQKPIPCGADAVVQPQRQQRQQQQEQQQQNRPAQQHQQMISIHPGFTEHAYRLVFPFEDRFAPDTPTLLTVLPSGVVENEKVLKAQKEKALMAFPYPQSISNELAESPGSHQPGGSVDSSSGRVLRDTAFVWPREDGTSALVQTWTTTLNEQFRTTFEIFEGPNPDSEKFQPQAVSEFQKTMTRLFGPAATNCPMFFCHKQTVNASPTLVGISEELLVYLKEHPDLMRELAILSIDSEGLGFVADVTDGGGKRSEKHFTMGPGEQYVVYRKVGWATMGCAKLLHQFLHDAELHKPPMVAGPAGAKKDEAAIIVQNHVVEQPAAEGRVSARSARGPPSSRAAGCISARSEISDVATSIGAVSHAAGLVSGECRKTWTEQWGA